MRGTSDPKTGSLSVGNREILKPLVKPLEHETDRHPPTHTHNAESRIIVSPLDGFTTEADCAHSSQSPA